MNDQILYARHLTDVLWYGVVNTYVHGVVHNPCGQDIASMYTSYAKREKPIYFQGQISMSLGLYKEFYHLDPRGQDIARTLWPRMIKLSIYTSYQKRKKSIFKIKGQISISVDLYKNSGTLICVNRI